MGPPSSDFPTPLRPMEIDLNVRTLNVSRTLPSPSVASTWEQSIFPPQASHTRGSPQGPLLNWCTTNNDPWIPQSVIRDIVSDDRMHTKHTGMRKQHSFGTQYRQPVPSDAGSFQYAVPHSDSGYDTLRSVGNTSVFGGDVAERDQDCQSLASYVADYQPFHGLNDVQQRDPRINDTWSQTGPKSSDPHALCCSICMKPVKTQSELK